MRQIGRKLSLKVAQKERSRAAMNPIAAALGKIEGLDTMRDAVEETRAVVDQMRAIVEETYNANQAIPFMIRDIQSLIYENVKQRAVNMKVMKAVSDGPKAFLVSGSRPTFSIEALVDMAEEFSVEYDFVYALIVLAENHCQPKAVESPEALASGA